ncbi:pheromone alpha factor receptor [Recurvomyces mirabilis]|uniref:Pheromone alpha factor receptor n=1 Tax=Recurvomyces mirabilis TaxID=574656 RepID=A0AAE1BZP3_9PEZI|nr:pheromone alpha factor receptor [Recurvomyces mirabilis]KAK5151429.1 pheromone alpha factor receptor [Recurvomyces mirabilis]
MAENESWRKDPTFDYYNQDFVLTAPDAITAVPASLADVLKLDRLIATQGVVFGVQAGITGLLFLILLLMTKRDKRQSAVFLLNITALLLIFITCVLWCVSLTGVFYNFYNWELFYYMADDPGVIKATRLSVTTEVLGVLVMSTIFSSLVLQIRIVCCTLSELWKRCILAVSISVALAVITVRFVLAVYNIKYNIIGLLDETTDQFHFLGQLGRASNACTVFAIAFFSAIFVTKLAFAIRLRRKLNMKQFGPMQIIFVMGCQTMIVPMIFAIVGDYATGHQLQSLVQTVVAIFLPLSGMWASAQTGDDKVIRPDARFHRAIPVGATDLSSAKAYGSTKTNDTTDTLVENDFDSETGRYQYTAASGDRGKMMIRSTSSPHGAVHFHPQGFDFGAQDQTGGGYGAGKTSFSEDLEMQRLKNEGVVVDRTYSVRSD